MESRNGLKAQAPTQGGDESNNATLLELAEKEFLEMGKLHRRLLKSVAEFDRGEAYKGTGYRDTAEYMSARYCYTLDEARRCVAAAHAIENFPQVSRALEEGRLELSEVVDLLGKL